MIKRPIRLIAVFVILTTLYLLLYTQYAHAQSQRTITIVPPSLEQKLNPGEKTEGVLKVINDSDEAITFRATVRDFVVNDTLGTPTLLAPNTYSTQFSAASWIGVSPSTFTVAPHSKQEINYYLQVPPNARPGGHYAAVTYTPVTAPNVNGSGATIQTIVGSLFSVNVSGKIVEKAAVTEFQANKFQEYGPVNVHTQIKNYGDLHIKPAGYITVTNIFGKTAYTIPLDAHNIFPTAARDFNNTFGKKLMVGLYKATLTAHYGVSNNLPLTASLTFWVFPWKAAVVVILIIIALLLALLLIGRKRKGGKEEAQSPDKQPEKPEGQAPSQPEDNQQSAPAPDKPKEQPPTPPATS